MTSGSDREKVLSADIIARCWQDAEYRHKLMAHPRKTLTEAGLSVPEHANVKVLEDQTNLTHLVLPEKPLADYKSQLLERLEKALPLKSRAIQVVQNSAECHFFVIPCRPHGYDPAKLNEAELAGVSGGSTVVTNVTVEGVVVGGVTVTVVAT